MPTSSRKSGAKNNTVGATAGGAANGTYNADIHLLGLSVTYRF